MVATLSAIFFLSGAAALIFEALWLRGCGLLLGNSVAATSIVLTSFMTGLALGNALAVRGATRLQRPLRLYAGLELGVGVVGVLVVLATPVLTPTLAPLFRWLGDAPALINMSRLIVAFVLLLLPTTAMGLTLPVLTRALSRGQQDFGRVLGHLYGWNTLGGALGAVAGELWLVGPFGVRGTACFAAGLNLLAAALAFGLSRRWSVETTAPLRASVPLGPRSRRILAAAFLSGASMLGLEVVWFRFLQLFLFGTTLTFAFMLAVILLGVGLGGLCASWWLRRAPDGHRFLPAVAAVAALCTIISYAAFSPWYHGAAFFIAQPGATLVLSLRLMLATSVVSGALFTLQGAALRHQLTSAGETAGHVTLANTLGAMTGALGAGFVLLPGLGMETSIFVLVVAYGLVATLCGGLPGTRRVWLGSLAAIAIGLALFPHGVLQNRHMKTTLARYLDQGTEVVASREGVIQTTTYLRSAWMGQPVSHRLVTNGHSMSGTQLSDRRYMKLFVHWATAVNPRIRRALLINYGLGSTAKALTDTRALTAIHVVDISRDILDMTQVVFPPGQSPLLDPRVHVHVEDGRFFLQTSGESFDLITGEPPPPKAAGIVSLYSREYFHLVHARLNDGGVATYWLPVEELDEDDARAVVGAFCAAFVDCSLWTGAGPHWMLVGTRGLRVPATEEAFGAAWRDPVLGPELRRLGLETPEQLGATFLADAEQLAPWIAVVPPLDDNHPHRLSPGRPHPARQTFIEAWMDEGAAALRFQRSSFIATAWPAGLREKSGEAFALQPLVNDVTFLPNRWPGLEALRDVLLDSSLATLPLLMAGSDPILQDIALGQLAHRASTDSAHVPALEEQLAIGALARRDYALAARHFATAADQPGPATARARLYQTFALMLAEKTDEARAALAVIDAGSAGNLNEMKREARWLHTMLDAPQETGHP